ncbi:hypothetical protein [Streptomyces sp. NPDC002994]|uniref:hypothetical protein n=1 Tax=Streptomyces sp. NPDC002994 TaxID=3154441 RepID=UPI0033BF4380
MTLTPIWPYTFERVADAPSSVRVTKWEAQVARTALISAAVGTSSIALTNVEHADEVVDVLPGPLEPGWRIETSPYSVVWPEGFTIDSPPAGDNSPFHLWGPDDALIYIQGPMSPERIPAPAQFTGPGQRLIDHRQDPAFEVVELAYQHDEAEWRQSHHLVVLNETLSLVVTAQCRATQAAHVRLAAESMARSVMSRAAA